MARPRVSLAGLMGFVVAASVGLAALRSPTEFWAGTILLATLGILCLAILGVIYRTGERRASWLGFALLGWGYLVLASGSWWDRSANRPELATSMLLDRLYPYVRVEAVPGASSSLLARAFGPRVDARNQAILAKLAMPVSMSFANETPLQDVLKYIKAATQGPNDNGLPFYVDPVGLKKAEATMSSTVTLDVEGLPLHVTLRLLLAQLGLAYEVRDGLVIVSAATDTSESFRRIGHCYWALVAGWLGSVAARRLHDTRSPAAPSAPGREA